MPMSISRSLRLCSVFIPLAILSACSENDAADVSFKDIDRSELPTNVVANQDLSASSTEWTGWGTGVDNSDGASATFSMESFPASQGGNTLGVNVINVEATNLPGQAYAGPVSVPVEPGKSYGVTVTGQGPRCGAVNLAAHPTGDPANVLKTQKFYLSGQIQAFDYYFEVPEGVTSVDLPVQLAMADNIGGHVYIDRIEAIPAALPSGSENNIVENGSFEESVNNEIDTGGTWGQAGSPTFSLVNSETTEPQDGEQLVQIEFGEVGTGNPWDIEAGPVGIPVQAGFTYTFSAWIKGDEGAKANFLVQNSQTYNVYEEQEVIVTPEWQEVRFDALVTDDAIIRLYAQYNFPENSNKTIYIDNFQFIPPSVCPYQPAATNLVSENEDLFEYDHVTNGGFEESDTDAIGWTNQVSGAAQADFDVQVTDPLANINLSLVYDGNNSIKATINALGDNPSDIQATPSGLYVVPGQTYIYSAFARGATGTTANFAATSADGATVYEAQEVTFDNIWQQITFDFTVPASAPLLTTEELAAAGLPEDAVVSHLNMAVWMSYPENEGHRFFLDNFSLLPNAAVNGDLEDSETAAEGWSWQTPEGITTFALDSEEAHTGSNSLKVDIGELDAEGLNVWDVQAGIADLSVTGGRKYYVSARIKGDADTRARFVLESAEEPYDQYGVAEGEDGDDADDLPDGIEVTDAWQEVTFEATIPNGVDTLRLMAQFGYAANANSTIYLDSFKVVSQTPPDPVAEGWLWEVPDGTTVELDNTEAVTDVYSLRVDVGDLDAGSVVVTDVQAGIPNLSVEGEGDYNVSAFIKGEAGTMATFVVASVEAPYDEYGSATDIALTGDWQEIKFQVSLPSDVAMVRLMAQLGYAANANTSVYLDSFAIALDPGIKTANLTSNGGVENGSTAGWNGNGATITAVSSSDAVYSGNYGLHVTGRTANWNSAQYSLFNSGIEEGSRYYASAWVKVAGDTADILRLTLQVTYDDGSNDYVGISATGEADTLSWTYLDGFVDFAPTGTVTDVKVYIEAEGAETEYYIDDLFVTKVYTPNGDLELGDSTGWNGSGAAQIVASQDDSYTGDYSLHVSGRTANWNSAQYNLLATGAEPGTYKVSVWVKVDGATEDTLRLTAQVSDDRESSQYTTLDQTSSTLDWVQLSGVFTFAPVGDATAFVVYIEGELAETNYYIDDLVVTEIIPPANLIDNGDLEYARTDNWSNSGSAVIAVTQDAAGVNSGNFGLQVTDRTANWNSAQYALNDVGLVEGASYMASAWVKAIGDTSDIIRMTLQITYETESTQYIGITDSGEADTLSWTKISGVVAFSPIDTVTDVRVYIEAAGAETSYYIDDLIIKRWYSPNGDVEDGTTGWNASGAATIEASTDEFYSGAQSLYISGRDANWNSAQYDLTNSGMEPGKTYNISAWVKVEGAEADTIKMTTELHDDRTDPLYFTIDQSTDTLDWVKLSSTYTFAPDGEATTFKVYFEAENVESNYYIDDLVITEADETYSY